MRGEKTTIILELIGRGVSGAFDLFEAFLVAGYGATPGKISRELTKIERRKSSADFERQARQNYYTLLSRLKRDGLIQKKKGGAKKLFALTSLGKNKLALLKDKRSEISLPSHHYAKESDNKFVIIAFDIPERERRKRNWLRLVLRDLGFTMVQQSVFIGKVKIPEDFLEDLRELKLISCIEIFEISKTGTLKHLT